MIWLMKTAGNAYRFWDTEIEDWRTDAMTRAQALELDDIDEEQLKWVDKHLCSCHARLGETFIQRNGRTVAIGGGDLAYHFDSYAEVAGYCDPTRNRG